MKHQQEKQSELLGYNVYQNGVMIAALSPNETGFIDSYYFTDLPEYTIGAVYPECESMSEPCIPNPISWIEVNTDSIEIALMQGQTQNEIFTITNSGTPQSLLNYQITVEPDTTTWLTVTPQTGNIFESGSDSIFVTIEAINIPVGIYEANIIITSNAANGNVVELLVKVDLITNIENLHQAGFFIHPNPTAGLFTIEGVQKKAKVNVFNTFGVSVFGSQLTLPAQVDLTTQPKGIYFIRMETETDFYFKKIVLN